jgi:tripeptide aminopeptidase
MFDKNRLKAVLSVQSKSHKDELMLQFINIELTKIHKISPIKVGVDDYGNIYISKGEADIYPCVVAHTDTVHDIRKGFKVIEVDGVFFAWDNVKHEQAGVGGDDKVGIYIALQALRDLDVVKIAFFRNEEVGCIGSGKAYMDFFNDVSFVLQADRKGNNDFIDHSNGVALFDEDFKSATKGIIESYGYAFTRGLSTDVGQLKKNLIECAVANVSCGYYNAHRDEEYVVIKEVKNCYELFIDLFHNLGSVRWEHKHVPAPVVNYHSYGTTHGYNSYGAHNNYGRGSQGATVGGSKKNAADTGEWGGDNWKQIGAYDYAANGYAWNETDKSWRLVGKGVQTADKDVNPMNESETPDESKKKEQTELELVGMAQQPITLLASSAGGEGISDVDYRIAKAKSGGGFVLCGVCPTCTERNDFWADDFNGLVCHSCLHFAKISDVDVIIDYVTTVALYEHENNLLDPEPSRFCGCAMEAVPADAFRDICQSCFRDCDM